MSRVSAVTQCHVLVRQQPALSWNGSTIMQLFLFFILNAYMKSLTGATCGNSNYELWIMNATPGKIVTEWMNK